MEEDEPKVISISVQTYWEIFPRLTVAQKNMLPLYIVLHGQAVFCESEELFKQSLTSSSTSYIFWEEILK